MILEVSKYMNALVLLSSMLFFLSLSSDVFAASSAKSDFSVPKACIQYSLDNSFPSIPIGQSSQFFVKCSSEKSEPLRGDKRPKYTNYDVDRIHQAFVKISDCFDVDAKTLFPKLMMESGFHINIQNPNGDAGIGQLTNPAIADVDQKLSFYKEYVSQSQKPSCRWLKSISFSKKTVWSPAKDYGKCSLLNKSVNPIKNILYVAIFQRMNIDYVEKEFREKNISFLLKENGFPKDKESALKKILVSLGYNTGGAVAVHNLETYLLRRLDSTQQYEFSVRNPFLSLLKKDKLFKAAKLSLKDFDFTASSSVVDNYKKQAIFKNTEQVRSQSDLEKLILKDLRAIPVADLSFPDWLKIWQSHGGPGYVSNMAQYALKANKALGNGVCADASIFKIQ